MTDLSKDSRFNQLPFISGPPSFRFYAGTPLTTKKGINIGSLFILDDVARPPLTADQEAFLGSVGQMVMKHMEINREAQERQKALKMSGGLNAFVEGKDRLSAEGYLPDSLVAHQKPGIPNAILTQNISESSFVEISNTSNGVIQPLDSSENIKTPSDQDSSQDESDGGIPKEIKDIGYRSTFVRAANLLRESLDLQTHGGVVFLDTAIGFHGRDDDVPNDSSLHGEAQNREIFDNVKFTSPEMRRASVMSDSSLFSHNTFSNSMEAKKTQRLAKIISFSADEPVLDTHSQSHSQNSFSPLGEDYLQQLLVRYPCGKIWSFDEDGNLSSSEEELSLRDDNNPSSLKFLQSKKRRLDANYLQKCFPAGNVLKASLKLNPVAYTFLAARELLFVPLWDSGASRWFSGCFAFSTSNLITFSAESELSFLRAFNNSVMAEG